MVAIDCNCDEVGLVQIICVKACSSLQRKELFAAVQTQLKERQIFQLLIDMKRYITINLYTSGANESLQSINQFFYKLGWREKNLEKRKKLDKLALTDDEWKRIGLFCNLLGLRLVIKKSGLGPDLNRPGLSQSQAQALSPISLRPGPGLSPGRGLLAQLKVRLVIAVEWSVVVLMLGQGGGC
ncbi:hypothetical protein B0H34DRAFT_677846 [Crassisporium funariophilum]|nr:hypothetical protein B0H34DRAFT_677846 [Crassisporium funariophilum]